MKHFRSVERDFTRYQSLTQLCEDSPVFAEPEFILLTCSEWEEMQRSIKNLEKRLSDLEGKTVPAAEEADNPKPLSASIGKTHQVQMQELSLLPAETFWDITEKGIIRPKKGMKVPAKIVVPKSVNGILVTKIGNAAFAKCKSLTSIELPIETVSIGHMAFEGCHALSSLKVPMGVTNIGSGAFWCCKSLISLRLPIGLTNIKKWTFAGCSSLVFIEIPSEVTDIGNGAFNRCLSLKKVIISDNIKSIGDNVFEGCDNLQIVSMPASWKKKEGWQERCGIPAECKIEYRESGE